MPAAQSLKDLMLLRAANFTLLDALPNQMGTALGFKKRTGQPVSNEPAVLVFVDHKIHEKWLGPGSRVPRTLEDRATGLTCPTDVIETTFDDAEVNFLKRDSSGAPYPGTPSDRLMSRAELTRTDDLTPENVLLLERLRGWSTRMTPGSQLGYSDAANAEFNGTLACFARDRASGARGFLTNHHIGEFVNNVLFHPHIGGMRVATVTRNVLEVPAAQRFPGLVTDPGARANVDAGFCLLDPAMPAGNVELRQPRPDATGPPTHVTLGAPLPLDLDTMGPISMPVIGVGRTRGFQRGVIHAFAYEAVYGAVRTYSDYLIVGEGAAEFSDPGDSGTLIVTAADARPVALLWGGSWRRGRHGHEGENWTDATDINFALDSLAIDLETS